MTCSTSDDVAKKLTALHLEFKTRLPDKISDIQKLWGLLRNDEATEDSLASLHRLAHGLVGSGGTFGAVVISEVARKLEKIFKSVLSEGEIPVPLPADLQQNIDTLLVQLIEASNAWQPAAMKSLNLREKAGKSISRLIYLAEDDELLAKDLKTKLEYAGYRVQHYLELTEFEMAFEREVPAAILMDVVFKDGDVSGSDTIKRLTNKYKECPPAIFISVRNDIEARLSAARAGARRYFCKPLNMEKLIPALDGLTERFATNPFKVLLIDDDESLLDYYSTILGGAGMVVEALSEPLKVLDRLNSFNPDVIISDIYMPECSGLELAQVIRQDDGWVMTPIIFLSTESDINRQLDAMHLGGDEFMVKPVEPNHLVSAVMARAKRARWTNRINNDLNSTLRENRFQLVTMNQHVLVSTADISGRITDVNDKFCEVSGYSREELLGQNHRKVKSDYHPDSFYKDMWDTISHGRIWNGTICNRKKSGSAYWVESTIVPFLDENGKPYKYVSARTDITATRLNEERLAFAVDGAGDGVWDWDLRSNSMKFSKLYMEMLGYCEDELPHAVDTWLASVHPDDIERTQEKLQRYMDGSDVNYSVELRLRCKDESYKWVLCRGAIVSRDVDNEPLRMIGIHSDITKQKESEINLVNAREDAENANRAKSQFLSSMSHELRTPLNAIMGFGQLLTMDKDSELSETQIDFATEIVKAGKHLLELINEILDLSRIEAGRIDLSIETIGLGEVVAESLQLIMPLAQKRGIEIYIHQNNNDVELDKLQYQLNCVRADRSRLRQVLLNLLSNAVKYNRENGKITMMCHHAEDNIMRVSITDTGIGIAEEDQARLFTAFSRLNADDTDVEGTGIGLVITKNIVELMGGHIGVDSRQDEGSTFWFELPTDTEQLPVPVEATPEILPPTKLADEHTMLYIEDNPANLRLVAQVMGRMNNIRMWSAHEPLLGLELAEEHKPDLILLDINLPGMDGFEVLKNLRQNQTTANIPVLAISANAMKQDIEKGFNAGFDDYITKPIDIDALMHSVSEAIKRSQ